MMHAIKKKVVIVSGASRGIGAAVAHWLATGGCRVVLLARTASSLQTVAEDVQRMGGHALALACDVRRANACQAAIRKAMAHFGRIDALVNNAGVLAPIARLVDASPEKLQNNLEVNLLGPMLLTQAAIPALRRQKGRVVNVSSGAATRPIEGWCSYCAAKAGLNHLTGTLAAEEPDLTVVAIRPGVVDTRMQALIRDQGAGNMSAEKLAYFSDLKKNGRLLAPRVPARVIAWLALAGPRHLSGEFVDAADERLAGPASQLFGNKRSE